MFTGLVTACGHLVSLDRGSEPTLVIRTDLDAPVKVGDSVAVDGACLTAVSVADGQLSFNLSSETLARSHFADLHPGRRLNLELPLKLQDFVGGHLVSGHLDGTARLHSRRTGRGSVRFTFIYNDSRWRPFLLDKGSIAVNGVSLTLVDVAGSRFSVEVIPQTLRATNLEDLRRGERVNVELDLVGKYLYNFALAERIHGK
ncbi:MAG: riboflavin synthase [Acidobacteriota bacterium]|jgi:riboflavin synthase|nr:riboflavin synthase [Acidobacteriota bacterium]